MILDTLDNLHKYVALNPRIQKVVDFIRENDLKAVPQGKVKIDGDDVFGNFQTLKGKTREEAKLETHNVMLDIQVPFKILISNARAISPFRSRAFCALTLA